MAQTTCSEATRDQRLTVGQILLRTSIKSGFPLARGAGGTQSKVRAVTVRPARRQAGSGLSTTAGKTTRLRPRLGPAFGWTLAEVGQGPRERLAHYPRLCNPIRQVTRHQKGNPVVFSPQQQYSVFRVTQTLRSGTHPHSMQGFLTVRRSKGWQSNHQAYFSVDSKRAIYMRARMLW